ncbi:hypothetical protein PI124_g20139 [Phytophthora idaei]|nr:hypothetical protein PI124_g20139 [Phytophthora idaei]
MAKSTIYSTLDLRDGFYQILMRESDIVLTAVSTPSGMLWEWLVMPQGLKDAPATFNRCVTHLLRSVRDFAPSYFDDVSVHSSAVNGKTDVEVHKEHLRKLLGLMRKHKLYANPKKCIFGASEIPILGCLVGKNGVRPDPAKARVINEWPTLSNVKEPLATASSVGSNKLKHRFIGPFAVLARRGASYTIDLPKLMKTHPTFYGPAAPQTPQASREEEDPTPRNENQPQTSSNVQRRKAKTHTALVDREASGTPEGLRTVDPQLVRLRPRCQVTKGAPDLLKLAESLIHIGRGRPATNPIMESRDLPAQLVQAVLELREDPAIPGLGGTITASPETQSDLEDKNALTETINLRVLRLSHSRKRCTQPGGAPRRRCLVLEVERGLFHLSSTAMERPTSIWGCRPRAAP